MSGLTFVLVFVGIQASFVVLDLTDRHRTRRGGDRDSVPVRTLLFLLVVLLVYLVLQYGGFALVPQPRDMAVDVRAYFVAHLGHSPPEAPMNGGMLVVLTVLGFYVSGLWDYLVHRFVSHSRWLWWTHEYHHLPTQVFVLMPGLAVRPFAVVAAFPVTAATIISLYAVLAGCGLPLWDLAPLQVLLLVQVLVLTSSHSCCLRRWGWVHRLLRCLALTTPQEHVLHHTVDLQGNYGNFTTLWDRLFGTYVDPERVENQGHALGLAYDQDFLGVLTLGRVKLSERLRRRFQVGRYCNLGASNPENA